MTISTLRQIERAHYKLMLIYEKAVKGGAYEAVALKTSSVQTWSAAHSKWKDAVNAAAAKRDKGVVLFTVFVPDRYCLREYVRTPNREIWATHWKRSGSLEYEPVIEPTIDSTPYWEPYKNFRRWMDERKVVAA